MLFCLHVLEHVPNDRMGISEMYRILKPGAVAYIMVPFMMGWKKTKEFGAPDPAIFDHVRGYAPNDFSDRLAPFDYEAIAAPAFLSPEEILRFRIPPDSQVIYRCLKRN
jgi:SAM-dependent methyltransferase